MPVGRPTKYKPEYCQQLIDYIEAWEPFYNIPIEESQEVDEKGKPVNKTKMKSVPNAPASLFKFAKIIGTSRSTLYEWASVHKGFSDSIKIAKDAMEEMLVDNGILGLYNASASIFALKNRCQWTDKNEVIAKVDLHTDMSDNDVLKRIKELEKKG